jgi:protein arginine kinase
VNEFLDRLAATTARWLSGHGPEARVVHSTRIRLARNLEKFPFPRKQDAGAQERLKQEARRVCAEANNLKTMNILDVDTLGPLDREFLVERHLISREFATGNGRLLLVDNDENVAIMVNEEDHFRFQVLRSGLDPAEAWQVLRAIERDVDNHVDFAFRPPWGYLTSCPTNLGTGMRISALCHLPALVFGNELHEIVQAAGQVGINVRGFYGEGSEAVGNFVQFSNRATMGHDEEEILGFMEGWIRQIIERELRARDEMLKKDRIGLEDRVHRAFGILSSARVMTSAEMMNLLSILRLGLDAAIITHPGLQTVNAIQVASQPAHLQRLEGKPLSPGERDQARARHIRGKLTTG